MNPAVQAVSLAVDELIFQFGPVVAASILFAMVGFAAYAAMLVIRKIGGGGFYS